MSATAWALVGVFIALGGFFGLRPELWRRLWGATVDPRPAALTRIAFGVVALWSLLLLLPDAGFLFSEDGLWTAAQARAHFGGGPLGPRSLLHLGASDAAVFGHFVVAGVALLGVIVGWRTRWMTALAWLAVTSLYNQSPIFYTGGDSVLRVFLFLGLFLRWGEAYSVDSWRRRRRAILGGAGSRLPGLRPIPAWPAQLMRIQLVVIYCATGLLKGGITWLDGSALYYALGLDHFYRHPAVVVAATLLQGLGILPLLTWITRLWELLFPLALVGLGLRAWRRESGDRRLWGAPTPWRRGVAVTCLWVALGAGAWVGGQGVAAAYEPRRSPWPGLDRETLAAVVTAVGIGVPLAAVGLARALGRWAPGFRALLGRWLLGRRLWLGLGLAIHLGIDLFMNVGTFGRLMLAIYPIWFSGPEIAGLWRGLGSRRPGVIVDYPPEAAAIRRVALLRCWDLCGRLEFVAAPPTGDHPKILRLRSADGRVWEGVAAGILCTRLFPGLWPLWPLAMVPGIGRGVGALVLRWLGQGGQRGQGRGEGGGGVR